MDQQDTSAKPLLARIADYLNLENERDDFDRIHETIEKETNFKGTNLWILTFAIIVASVGLNMNSTAVIIGAMLISPLMGPINGMGYSIATYNFPLFRKSVRNFTFAVLASVIASTTYFIISPISTAHSELLARTSPSIYDVLIALFGGLAGIVAISSRLKGNVIPGVAIATALMPPLCTSGYGLATGQLDFFFGAFYLFTINTVFIALSSVLISQILKFPIRSNIDPLQKRRINNGIWTVILLVFIPSIYFGYVLVQKEKFKLNASKYIENISIVEGNFLLRNKINENTRQISLIYGGPTLNEEQKDRIRKRAMDFSLDNTVIQFTQGLKFEENTNDIATMESINRELNEMRMQTTAQQRLLDSLERNARLGKQYLEEIKVHYSQIVGCTYAAASYFEDGDDMGKTQHILYLKSSRAVTSEEKIKITKWFKKKLQSEDLVVVFEKMEY